MPALKKGVTPIENFWDRVDPRRYSPDDCWPCPGSATRGGYVQVTVAGRRVYAHVLAYELEIGSVPQGCEVDHTCHTRDQWCRLADACPHRRCCNPAHLEAVTPRENNLRARYPNSDKTHCPANHSYAERGGLSGGRRHCKECARLRAKATRDRLKAQAFK